MTYNRKITQSRQTQPLTHTNLLGSQLPLTLTGLKPRIVFSELLQTQKTACEETGAEDTDEDLLHCRYQINKIPIKTMKWQEITGRKSQN